MVIKMGKACKGKKKKMKRDNKTKERQSKLYEWKRKQRAGIKKFVK